VNIKRLLRRVVRWLFRLSPNRRESLILEELVADRARAIQLNRQSDRAICTWKIIYADLRCDLNLAIDTLEYVDNLPPVERTNKLSTHLVSIIQVSHDSRSKQVLLSAECNLRTIVGNRSYATAIAAGFARLALKYDPDTLSPAELFEEVAKKFLGAKHRVFLK
jgi:hypothetical protein